MAKKKDRYDQYSNMEQEQLFEDNSKPKPQSDDEVAKDVDEETQTSAPASYIKVQFDSLGKLSAPPILHFRNYTMEEAIEMADMTRENETEVIVRILNNLVYEDFDCGLLHPKEAEYALLSIYAKWWNNVIDGMPYFKDVTITDPEQLRNKSNVGRAVLPIENIETAPIKSDFEEPIEIDLGEQGKYGFILPRMNMYIRARNFVRRKYRNLDRFYSDFRMKLHKEEKNPGAADIDPEMEDEYREHERQKQKDELRVQQALHIQYVNGEELEDNIETRLKALKEDVPATAWKAFRAVEKENMFGVKPDVSFFEEQSGEFLTRRFRFRLLDYLPSMDT